MLAFAIWTTTACNMQCTYCYEGNNKESQFMSQEVMNQTLRFIKAITNSRQDEEIVVDFHGGEPLLQFSLIKNAVEELKNIFKDKVTFGITTNGTIMTDEIADFLCKEFYYSLSISLDGDEKNHNLNRKLKDGCGSYDKTVKSAKMLLARRNDVRVRPTINTITVSDLYDCIMHLINLGFKTIAPAVDYFDFAWNKSFMNILEEQLRMIKNELNKQEYKNIRVGMINDYRKDKIGECSGGVNSFHINPNGKIYPCVLAVGNNEYLLGSVCSGLLYSNIDKFREINKIQNECCSDCSHKNACLSSRCKLINKQTTNDLYTPSPVICAVENIKKRLDYK